VGDRVAQMVLKLQLEPVVEPCFHRDSYGYRPGKSAIEAIGETRKRCWRYHWVLDLDIKGFFDNIDHSLMMRAVRKHTDCPWMLLYIERWLKAPAQMADGTQVQRTKGLRKAASLPRCLPTSFCITPSTSGWPKITRTFLSSVMRTILLCTVDQKLRRKSSGRRLRSGSAHASWKYILERRNSSIVGIATGPRNIPT